ncbi:MAG: polysaccharide biosynthesis C-terminal domain-containing protein, partial [Pararhodobacter sp.]
QPLYYAREDTKRPFRYAAMSMLVNVVLAVGLMPVIGFAAAALATTLAAWAMVWQLWAGSRGMGDAARFDERMRSRFPRILGASLFMGLALWGVIVLLTPYFTMDGLRYLALLAVVLSGMVFYFGAGAVIGAFRLSDFTAALKRRR